jgi:hypothetical protein
MQQTVAALQFPGTRPHGNGVAPFLTTPTGELGPVLSRGFVQTYVVTTAKDLLENRIIASRARARTWSFVHGEIKAFPNDPHFSIG